LESGEQETGNGTGIRGKQRTGIRGTGDWNQESGERNQGNRRLETGDWNQWKAAETEETGDWSQRTGYY